MEPKPDNPMFAMLGPMLPMILGMINEDMLTDMAEMIGQVLTDHHDITEVTVWGKDEYNVGEDYTPAGFAKLILQTVFNSVNETV